MTVPAKISAPHQNLALQREAGRLLTRLAQPDIRLAPDLSDAPTRFILSKRRNGVSVSCGSFSTAALAWLVSQGALIWQNHEPTVFIITEAGLARLRRMHAAASGREQEGFIDQHLDLRMKYDSKTKNAQVVNESESPLAWLVRRKNKQGHPLISMVQFQAGERLRTDLTLAAMLPRTTVNWQALGGGSGGAATTHSELVTGAQQRVQKAMAAVGPDLNGLLMDLCGFLKGLEQIERERSWPPRSGKIVLGLALDRLATHYGLAASVQGPDYARMRQWGTEDYRPAIS